MKKLKLEDIEVTSFETSAAGTRVRGTIQAHGRPRPPMTYSIEECGDTQYFDCTFGCSQNTGCPSGCIVA